jgi:hypothetical protein
MLVVRSLVAASAMAGWLLLAGCSGSSGKKVALDVPADSGPVRGSEDSGASLRDSVAAEQPDSGTGPEAATEAGTADTGTALDTGTNPIDATAPPSEDAASDAPSADTAADAVANEDAPAAITWAYLYPKYFAGQTTADTPGHCSSNCHVHNEGNTATDSTLVQAALMGGGGGLTLFGGGMPRDNPGWTDPTAAADVTAWGNAGFP